MKFKELLDTWESAEQPAKTSQTYSIHLNAADAAKIHALSDLYPGVDHERIISDLLSAALEKAEAAIPYVPGDKVIREDEFGDPIYEDSGLTPRYLELSKKHLKKLKMQAE